MALSLSDFLEYEDIVVQCHDNPDADAIASGFALCSYLSNHNKKVRFIYGGRFEVTKSNLRLMINTLKIPIEYVKELDKPKLLITVDCQYGESNVSRFEAEKVAVIDHHQISGELPEMSDVRSGYGACSTIMWKLLEKEHINVNNDEYLATALYYGLLTDTNEFAEIHHPADKDVRDGAHFINSLITRYRNSNLSMEELLIAGEALKHTRTSKAYKYAVVEARPCDPNILGIISDMVLEVDSIETVLVYSILEFGIKMSVRSCVREVQASELAAYIADGIGGGGGHLIKAGGFLKKDLIEKKGITYEAEALEVFLRERMDSYFSSEQIIYAGKFADGKAGMLKYVKKPVEVGFVPSLVMGEEGERITVRTLEGDVDIATSEDNLIIIGVEGEVYPCKLDRFNKSYELLDKPYVFEGEYAPSIINSISGDRIEILSYAQSAVANGGGMIYAKELTKRVKVFTSWDTERYYLGKVGDYLAVRTDDYQDVYIIDRTIFEKTYERVEDEI